MCCMWFAHDGARATAVNVLETVHGTVRRLSPMCNCTFHCDYHPQGSMTQQWERCQQSVWHLCQPGSNITIWSDHGRKMSVFYYYIVQFRASVRKEICVHLQLCPMSEAGQIVQYLTRSRSTLGKYMHLLWHVLVYRPSFERDIS